MSYVEVDHKRLYYVSIHENTAGRTLVLVHGAGGSHTVWGLLTDQLRRATLPLITMDLPGRGRSQQPGASSIEAYADVVAQFVEALGLQQVVLGGHSMGGATALQVALGRPPWLEGLLLVSTGARLRVQPAFLAALEQHDSSALQLMEQFGFGPGADQQIVQNAIRELQQCDAQVIFRDFKACDQFSIMDRITQIETPSLVCCGDADLLTPLKYSTYLADNMPRAELAVFEGAGHMLPLERPAELAHRARAFIERL